MNATDTTARITAHSNCDHPKTKAARAACRRGRTASWTIIDREAAVKGSHVRVTCVEGEVIEGELIGWGAKRLIVRTETVRVNLVIEAVELVEVKG